MDISIIVPVYNVEKYLQRCLDSICNQHFNGSFEVIAVDDLSTDNSLKILREYAKNDKRIKVIEHLINKKLSVARSTGMREAKGTYIMHIDSDDWLLPDTLEMLYAKAIETKADVLIYNYCIEDMYGNNKKIINIIESQLTLNKLSVYKFFEGTVVNKLVKKELTSNMIYGQNSINSGEDIIYNTEIFLKATSFYLFPLCAYVYFRNNSSITNSINAVEIIQGRKKILEILYNVFLRHSDSFIYLEQILERFEKVIVRYSFQFWLNRNQDQLDKQGVIDAFKLFQFTNSKRLNVIDSVLSKRNCSLYYNLKYFGIKHVLSQIYHTRKLFIAQ